MTDADFVLPASKSKVAKLGTRLVDGTASADDWALYGAVLDVYDRAQVAARRRLDEVSWTDVVGRELDMAVSGRAKTLDTLTQKLERTPAIKLPYIRDIAGVRLVGDFTLSEQDLIAHHCATMFDSADAQVIDRRLEPEAGYRALHVVVTIGQIPVEVQVRTHLQGLWADLFERVADTWGRQIRYGQDPDAGQAVPGSNHGSLTRTAVVDALQALSVVRIQQVEVVVDAAAVVDGLLASPPLSTLSPSERMPADVGPRIDGVETYGDLVAYLDTLRAQIVASKGRLADSILRMAELIEPAHHVASSRHIVGDVEERS